MFYYTYKISFDDNTYYYGSRGCKRLPEFDTKYLSSSIYVKTKISEGILFRKDIVAVFDTRDKAYDAEYQVISEHIKFVKCMNKTLPNKASPSGKTNRVAIVFPDTGKQMKVPKYKLEEYIDLGAIQYILPPQCMISKNNTHKRVSKTDYVNYYKYQGWTKYSKTFKGHNRYMYHKDTFECLVVPKDQIEAFSAKGYIFGRGPNYQSAVKNTVRIVKNNISKRVAQSELNEYLTNGWLQEGVRKNKRTPSKWVFNETTNYSTYVPINQIDDYINRGYIVKNPHNKSKGKVWIHTTFEKKTINKSELKSYLDAGWKPGTGASAVKGKIWANDGVKNYMSTQEIIDKNGYQLGRIV